jgi:hypothetical protein
MKNMIVSALAMAVVLVACGPSSKELATVRQARYTGDKAQLFTAAKGAVEAKYKIQKADDATLGMQTEGRWYSPEGQGISADTSDARSIPNRSINVALVVLLIAEGDAYAVSVKPLLARFSKGQPRPEPLDPADPSVPGWVSGKVDQLQFDVHAALAQWEVKQPGGVAPAPAPAPATAPAAPDPAAGSAAPAPAPAFAP